jgi:hypothetical protein
MFAGQPILFSTNAPKLAHYASDFLTTAAITAQASARITLKVRTESEPRLESAPWFRARGHFAVARFTSADTLWFNLRTREVLGSFSAHLANDRDLWRNQIFPTLLGVIAAAIHIAPVHAACIAHRAGGVLLAGHSGAGKSTLTISLARRGYALLGDDWTYLSGDGANVQAWSVPVPVKLLPDALRFFPELATHQPGISLNGELAYEVNPEQSFGISRRSRSGVSSIVLLQRANERGVTITPIDAEEAIEHLIAEVEPLQGSLAYYYRRQIDLIRQLGHTTCFRALFNDHPDTVAAAIDSALLHTREL